MTTVICATNRPKNQTQKIVEFYASTLNNLGEQTEVLGMNELPKDFIWTESYGNRTDEFNGLVDKYIIKADRLVIVAPEYNGSYPGVFKAFLDANSPSIYQGKKVALVGVASGRAGNIRGMDHLVQVAHHLGMSVLPNQIPISKLHEVMDDSGVFNDEETGNLLKLQAAELLAF